MTQLFNWLVAYRIHDPAWVQAYSSAVLVILSFITLAVLIRYAWDTRKLANTSVEQVNNAQTPFLALIRLDKEADPIMAFAGGRLASAPYQAWAVQNQGNAAAVNIRVSGESTEGATREPCSFSEPLNPIPAGASVFIGVHPAAHIIACTFGYSSLDGRKFCTEVATVNGEFHVEFLRS